MAVWGWEAGVAVAAAVAAAVGVAWAGVAMAGGWVEEVLAAEALPEAEGAHRGGPDGSRSHSFLQPQGFRHIVR